MQCATSSRFCCLLKFLRQRIIHCFLVTRLGIRKLPINLRLRLLEIRMCLSKLLIICLKRGYLPSNEGDLAAYLVFWWKSAIYHAVEIINVFSECFQNRIWLLPDE